MARERKREKVEGRRWSGALTIHRATELKEDLSKALAAVDRLSLDLSEATEIDLAGLQLLCSGHRTAARLNKQLSLAGTERLLPVLRDAGFVRHIGCALDCGQNCLWTSTALSGKEQ